MFKQHHHIIFIILLILALQFQLLHPAYVECVSRVYVAVSGASIHQNISAVLQASLLNLCLIHVKI